MTTSLTIFVIIHQLGRQDAEIQTKVEELNKQQANIIAKTCGCKERGTKEDNIFFY